MSLKASKGNMYERIDLTVNPLGGKCEHNCFYCYVEDWKKRLPAHLKKYSGNPRIDENGLRNIKGENKNIFIVSMNDLFAKNVPSEVILKIIYQCHEFDNTYLFQTKNPERLLRFQNLLPKKSIICTTIETNRFYSEYMGNTPNTYKRALALSNLDFEKEVTIEPILDFDLEIFISLIKLSKVNLVNIGADSKKHNMHEPSKEKTLKLISELNKFTKVHLKKNLNRIIK